MMKELVLFFHTRAIYMGFPESVFFFLRSKKLFFLRSKKDARYKEKVIPEVDADIGPDWD